MTYQKLVKGHAYSLTGAEQVRGYFLLLQGRGTGKIRLMRAVV